MINEDRAKGIFIISLFSLLIVALVSTYFWYDFSSSCKDYLKLAGDAPSVKKADEFLGVALEHIDSEELTSGYSAYIFDKPDNNLKIWSEQIRGAKETTADILSREENDPESVNQLEKDNALMKIREVVLDDSSTGTIVTVPTNITWYPFQWIMLLWWIITIVALVISGFIVFH